MRKKTSTLFCKAFFFFFLRTEEIPPDVITTLTCGPLSGPALALKMKGPCSLVTERHFEMLTYLTRY